MHLLCADSTNCSELTRSGDTVVGLVLLKVVPHPYAVALAALAAHCVAGECLQWLPVTGL